MHDHALGPCLAVVLCDTQHSGRSEAARVDRIGIREGTAGKFGRLRMLSPRVFRGTHGACGAAPRSSWSRAPPGPARAGARR